MDQFGIGSVVWASARGDIFWPGEVIESNNDNVAQSKQAVTVHFFSEDSYEVIKSPNKLFAWNCEKQNKFIEKGRALKNAERKLMFNKAVAEADSLFSFHSLGGNKTGISSLQENSSAVESMNSRGKEGGKQMFKKILESEKSVLRRSPRKKMANGLSAECYTPAVFKSVKKVTENQTSYVVDVCSSVGNNCEQVKLSHAELDDAATHKGNAILTAVCPARRSDIKNKSMLLDSSQKCNGMAESSSENDSNVSRAVGRKKGKRKLPQNGSTDLTLTERQDATISDLTVQSNDHDVPFKRKMLDEDTPSKKEQRFSQTLKLSDHNGVEGLVSNSLPSKTALANGHIDSAENKDLGVSGGSVSDHQEVKDDDNMGSSDDELLEEAFSPVESNKFSVGDIVWAKYYREPYWPALIKKVTGKTQRDKKFIVQFLGWSNCLYMFKIQPKKLAHFACESTQRAEFMRVKTSLNNEELEKLFDEAVIQAEHLLNRKGLGMSLGEEIDEGDVKIFEEKDDDVCEKCGKEEGADQSENTAQSPSTSLVECRKSLRAKKPVSKYRDILSFIRQAKPTLEGILNGTKPSQRHEIFTHGRVSEKNSLKRRSGFGPIADENLHDKIMDLLKEFYQELKGNPDITYLSDVWLPEAIIWAICQIDHVDRQTAEQMFRDGSKYAVSKDEVQELTTKLKQRKPSDEEKQERLRKAERAFARFTES